MGFEKTGKYQTVAAIESNSTYFGTLTKNRGFRINKGITFLSKSELINDKVENITGSHIINLLDGIDGNDDFVLVGGPPCQSFSTIGKRNGLTDERGLLIFEFSRLVKEIRPNFFIFENVPNMAQQWNGKVLKKLLSDFKVAGYNYVYGILNAADYGSYTKRRRLIIIGTKDNKIQICLPPPTHQLNNQQISLFKPELKEWCKVKDVIEDLPDPHSAEAKKITHHKAVNHTCTVKERFKNLEVGKQDKIRKRWKLDPDLPSPSLMAGGNGGYVFHIHYKYPRELTSRECASIQGFPIEYEFNGKPLDVAKQIVNAVPIQLSEALANHLFSMFKN